MAKGTKNAADTFRTLIGKVNAIRERDENKTRVPQNERDNVRDTLGRMLDASDDPDANKKIRRQLRRLGHRISVKGKPWQNAAKRPRKAKNDANANASDETPIVPENVTENA